MNRKEIQQLLGSENRLKRRLDQGKYDFCEVWEVALGSRGRRGVMKVYDNKLAPGGLMKTDSTLERRSFKPLPLTQEMLIETIRKSRSSVSASSLKQYELERQQFEGGEQPRKVIGFC